MFIYSFLPVQQSSKLPFFYCTFEYFKENNIIFAWYGTKKVSAPFGNAMSCLEMHRSQCKHWQRHLNLQKSFFPKNAQISCKAVLYFYVLMDHYIFFEAVLFWISKFWMYKSTVSWSLYWKKNLFFKYVFSSSFIH